jgi:hypothetical protein
LRSEAFGIRRLLSVQRGKGPTISEPLTTGCQRESFCGHFRQVSLCIKRGHVSERSEAQSGLGSHSRFTAGFRLVEMGIGMISLFERRPWTYVLVNGGYLTVALVIRGPILGRWQ